MTASDVKLDTGGLSRMILEQSSARTGPSCFSKIPMYFNILVVYRGNYGASVATAFSARRQDLPSAACKTGSADCFAGIRPILKSSFTAVPAGRSWSRGAARHSDCKAF